MLPTMRQRLVVLVAVLIGAAIWLSMTGLLAAADGSSGISLMSAHVGVPGAVAIVAIAGLPVFAIGLAASAMGNPLSGVFGVSAGLCVLAGIGGAIDGWMIRADLPFDYGFFMIEILIWQAGIVVMLSMIQKLRSPMRAMWPALAYDDHLGVDIHLRHPQLQAWAAGGVCAVCGLMLGNILIRSSDPGQVIMSLLIAFFVGGAVAGVIFPKTNPVGVLFSPALAALVSYGYVLLSYSSGHEVLEAWYSQRLPGMALVLPIYYVSAGVAGCTLGVGFSQTVEAAKMQVAAA